MPDLPVIRLLNLDLHNVRRDELMHRLREGIVFTPNVDHLMRLQRDRAFYETYAQADYRLCDSRIVQGVSAFATGQQIVEQIAGSDFFPAFVQHIALYEPAMTVFLLGGSTPGVAQAARDRLDAAAGRRVVADAYAPPRGFEHDDAETARIVERICASGATVLAVGVGSPKQEHWIVRHRDSLPGVQLFFGVGATIDFIAGHQRRAPRWMTRAGLEWLFRLVQEPRRLFRRYLIEDLPFFWLVLRQRLGRYRDPFGMQSRR
ncbi:MAG: WecB/TagA/CpsF family glycosyltransferase [Bacteroidia bacterium]